MLRRDRRGGRRRRRRRGHGHGVDDRLGDGDRGVDLFSAWAAAFVSEARRLHDESAAQLAAYIDEMSELRSNA